MNKGIGPLGPRTRKLPPTDALERSSVDGQRWRLSANASYESGSSPMVVTRLCYCRRVELAEESTS